MELDGTKTREALSLFERLLDILQKPMYSKSAYIIEELLTILEVIFAPLSHLPKDGNRGVQLNSRVRKDLFLFSFLRSIHANFYIEN